MAFHKRLTILALLVGVSTLGTARPARATMQLEISSGSTTLPTISETSQGLINVSNVSFDSGLLSISSVIATSNSASNGPGVDSKMGIGSVLVQNNTGSVQTIVLTLSDVGFNPDSTSRPLTVYNSASVTFFGFTGPDDSVTFQTFAYDGTSYFQTSGTGVVATDPVVLPSMANGSTTTALFAPQNSQFSLTDVLSITLDPGDSILTTSDVSLVHAPEPGTPALVLSGSIMLGIGHRVRRRRITG